MSNFLTNVKIGNLQTELDALSIYTKEQVFAGGLKNPLGSPMLCQGNNIVDAGSITGQGITVLGESNLNYIVASGNVDANSFTQSFDGTTYASITDGVITGSKVSTDTIESKTSGGTVNMLNEVDMNSNPISKTNYIGFNGQVAGAPYLTIQNNATLTTRGFGYSEQGGVDPVIFYDNKYNKPPGSGSVGTLEQVLTQGSDAPDNTMTVLGVTTNSLSAINPLIGVIMNDKIAGNGKDISGVGVFGASNVIAARSTIIDMTTSTIAGFNGQDIVLDNNLDGNGKDITGVGTVAATVVGAPSINSTTLTTGYISGTDSSDVFFNNNITMSQHDITAIKDLGIGSDTVYNTLLTGGTNPAQLYVTRGDGLYGAVYDSHYNQPPNSGGTQNLEQVLTEGSDAPNNTMTVLGVTTNSLSAINTTIGVILNDKIAGNGKNISGVGVFGASNVIASRSTIIDMTTSTIAGFNGQDIILDNNLDVNGKDISAISNLGIGSDTVYNTLLTGGANPLQLYVTRDGTTFGSVYDSHYNQPPGSGSVGTLEQVLTAGNTANHLTIDAVGQLQLTNTADPTKISNLTTGAPGGDANTLWVYHDSRGYGAIYDSLYNQPPSAAIPTLTEVLTANNSAPALDMTVNGITVESIAGSSASTDPVSPGPNLSITTGVVLNNNYIHNCSEFKLSTLSPTEYCYMMPHPSGGLQITSTGWGTGTGVVFDTEYNKLPPVVTPTLDEVLTAGASATSKTITVGGVTTDALKADAALGIIVNGSLRMTETPSLASYLTFINTDNDFNAINTVTDGALGPTLCVTRDGTTKGFIYDSHYNQPPTAAASTLEEVLAAGAVALGSQGITVGSLVGNHAVDSTHTDEYLSVGSDVDYSSCNQLNIRSSSIVDVTGVNKNTLLTGAPFSGSNEEQLYITRGNGQYGAVYDSHYNQPPAPNSSSSTLVIPNNNLFNTFVDLTNITPDPNWFIWGTVGEFNFATNNTDFNTFTLTYDTFTVLNPYSALSETAWTMYLSTSFDAYYADIPVGFISLNSLNFQPQTGTNLVLSKGLLQSVMNPGLESNKVYLMWFTEVRTPTSVPLSLAFTNLQVVASSSPISSGGGFTPNSS